MLVVHDTKLRWVARTGTCPDPAAINFGSKRAISRPVRPGSGRLHVPVQTFDENSTTSSAQVGQTSLVRTPCAASA